MPTAQKSESFTSEENDNGKTVTSTSNEPTTIPVPAQEAESIHIEKDTELNRVKTILSRTHDAFYERKADSSLGMADVRIILPAMRKAILEGICIVFSGVIPLGNDPKK